MFISYLNHVVFFQKRHFLTKALRRTNYLVKKGTPPYQINCIDISLLVEPASNPTIVHIIAALIGQCSLWANNVVEWLCLCWFYGRSFFTTRRHNNKGKVPLLFLEIVRFCERDERNKNSANITSLFTQIFRI